MWAHIGEVSHMNSFFSLFRYGFLAFYAQSTTAKLLNTTVKHMTTITHWIKLYWILPTYFMSDGLQQQNFHSDTFCCAHWELSPFALPCKRLVNRHVLHKVTHIFFFCLYTTYVVLCVAVNIEQTSIASVCCWVWSKKTHTKTQIKLCLIFEAIDISIQSE